MRKRLFRAMVCALAVTAGSSALHAQTLPPLKTVFVIVMENRNWSEIAGNAQAPYINSLLSSSAHAEAYFTPPGNHPSGPNYLWLEAGQNFGLVGLSSYSPAANHQSTTNHLVTQLKNAGISWKAYQESIDGGSCPLTDSGLYAVRHDPFVFFDDVTGGDDPASTYCISHVRPYTELASDLAANAVPSYSFITPNLCSDMHDCSIATGDQWLSHAVPAIQNSQAYASGGVIFIVWDEGSGSTSDGPLGMIAVSPAAKAGYANNIYYTHSSLLRTIQGIFGVGPVLGDAANATDLSDLFTSFPAPALPAPWSTTDIGAVGVNGSVTASGNAFTVRGAGADIWSTSDSFRFVYQPAAGDLQIVARVTSLQNTNVFAKAGVTFRDSLNSAAAQVLLDIKPDGGVEFMQRASGGAATSLLGSAAAGFPVWLRLARSGSVVSGSISADGQSWTPVGTTAAAFSGSSVGGLAVTSHTVSTLTTALFDNVALTPLAAMATRSPFNGAAASIPGTLQAEDFDNGGEGTGYHDTTSGNSGGQYRGGDVDIEAAADSSGGYDVGWIAASEWLTYTVNVAYGGLYTLDARVACNGGGGTFHVEAGGVNVTGSLTVPNTGGWQAWTTVSTQVSLPAGTQVLKVVMETNGSSGVVGNMNWLRFTAAAPPVTSQSTPFTGSPLPVPGSIEAEHFDAGGEGVAYHDTTQGNAGGQYRALDVDIEATADSGNGYNVGWIAAGEWLNYSVNVASAGSYALDVRVACSGGGGTFHVEVGGANVTGSLSIPNTGGWQAWTTVSATVTLPAGQQTVKVVMDANGASGVVGNMNWLRFTQLSSTQTPPGSTPGANVVIDASDIPASVRHGSWNAAADSSSPNGIKLATPDNGIANTNNALANPSDYVDVTFTATAGTPYAFWIRLKALNNSKYNDSLWVQFSDALVSGSPAYAVGTTDALLVNLATDGSATSLSGWGWQNGAYWLAQPAIVTFPTTGTHTLRIQVREDGVQFDQIVLSPGAYLTTPPGPVSNDATIIARP